MFKSTKADSKGWLYKPNDMRRRRIVIPLPNTASMHRKRNIYYMRGIIFLALVIFILLQLHAFNYTEPRLSMLTEATNDSNDAILSMVPVVLHKFLTPKTRNQSHIANAHNSTYANSAMVSGNYNYDGYYHPPNISEIKRLIAHYNNMQTVLNEDSFGPLQNDSVIIVIQVHTRITYLRHLIVSLAQARDISKTLLIFSHDYFDDDINDLIQTIDFCKVMQIFYPYSIQTHPNEFPGVDPDDCPRDIKKDQAIIRKCNNALYPDLYGHYREAKFTQTKHHWWWKANRVFDQLDVTRNHTGLVLFLEEDHYVAEDFLYLLEKMQKRTLDLCPQCNILSLGTYLKTFNYYTYNSKQSKALVGDTTNVNAQNNHITSTFITTDKSLAHQAWNYQVLPSLYSIYQKVEIMPWISSKHNMGFAFNRSTWSNIRKCGQHFCSYDDYNWDWSLQHLSQQCLQRKLHAMIVKGPRVFHIGECGVHHKKKNCESNQVISKVQQVLRIAKKSGQLFPRSLTLTAASVIKKTKLRKGNGGWGDKRDRELCTNMTLSSLSKSS